MPFIEIAESPLRTPPGSSRVHYRTEGEGFPLIFLHGGWGYEIYPFDAQIAAFGDDFRIVIPDRTGYGQSPRINHLTADFHLRAAEETLSVLDGLRIDQCIVWGHSDGAVIAANLGIVAPERFRGIVLEAFHYDRAKIHSREFFEQAYQDPNLLSERTRSRLAREHGEDYWGDLIRAGARAWLEIARDADDPAKDLFRGRLSELRVPTLFIHGSDDPRTEPDELSHVRAHVPQADYVFIKGGEHAPHSERDVVTAVNLAVAPFLEKARDGWSRET